MMVLAIDVEAVAGPPFPRAGIIVTGLGGTEHTISIWRWSEGERVPVRGARSVSVVDSFYVEDFEVPLARDVYYELEIVAGENAGVQISRGQVNLESECGYIQDPLDPSRAVPIRAVPKGNDTFFAPATFSTMAYESDVSTFNVMGSNRPVAIAGPRRAASGIPFSMVTVAERENRLLRDLVMQAPLLVIRPLPEWGTAILGSATYSAASMEEQPLRHAIGGVLTRWETTGDVVRGSGARVLVALYTYQDVAQIFATYDQKQAALVGKTYLDDVKAPLGDTEGAIDLQDNELDGGTVNSTFEYSTDGGNP